ncbi:hypothetical protein B0H11DRAFT_1933570 [Mycena galericulata]|nr:hypothetical protein B0H11DRAFT_1933570 [Mycena galericulata]
MSSRIAGRSGGAACRSSENRGVGSRRWGGSGGAAGGSVGGGGGGDVGTVRGNVGKAGGGDAGTQAAHNGCEEVIGILSTPGKQQAEPGQNAIFGGQPRAGPSGGWHSHPPDVSGKRRRRMEGCHIRQEPAAHDRNDSLHTEKFATEVPLTSKLSTNRPLGRIHRLGHVPQRSLEGSSKGQVRKLRSLVNRTQQTSDTTSTSTNVPLIGLHNQTP